MSISLASCSILYFFFHSHIFCFRKSHHLPPSPFSFPPTNILILSRLGTGWTHPNSHLRTVLIVLIAITCYKANSSHLLLRIPSGAANHYVIGSLVNASQQLCLAKRVPPSQIKTPWRKFLWGLNQSLSPRWDARYVPSFDSRKKSYVPTRGVLFRKRLWDLIWLSAVIYILSRYKPVFTQSSLASGPLDFVRRPAQEKLEEILLRAFLAFKAYTLSYAGSRAGHAALCCVYLACGDEAKNWPPLFGSFAEAYTLRRWYS